MSHFWSKDVRKARKDHVCCACHLPIPRRAEYIFIKEIGEDNNWLSSKWHTECRDAFDDMLRAIGEPEAPPEWAWDGEGDGMPQEIQDKYIGMALENELLLKEEA